jgi:hypothetical protein
MTLNCFIPAPPLKLIDLPGIDQRAVDDSVVSVFFELLFLYINAWKLISTIHYYGCTIMSPITWHILSWGHKKISLVQ